MEKEYPHRANLTFQVLMDKNKRSYEYQLIDESVYQSNFNQMYMLGRYDHELFEEVYNVYPLTRMFKFKFREDPNYTYVYKGNKANSIQ